jgi:beta-barrel assembly-enhancing protease
MSMPSDGARFVGVLSDGRTAAAKSVTIRIAGGGLELRADGDYKTRIWPYDQLRSSVPVRSDAGDVLLSLQPDGAETLFVNNPTFAGVLLPRVPALSSARRRWQGLKPGLAVVACVAALVGSIWALNLQPSQAIARILPQQSRQALGDAVIASLAKDRKVCETPASKAALDRLTKRLVTAAANVPPDVRVIVLDWPIVNAFAAPGGQIILTRGLVQRAGSADEVAGVLAHELGHVLELHPEAGIIRFMGLSAAAQLVFAGSSGTLTNAGVALTTLRYSRIAEREADGHALRILKGAGISHKGFADFFERIEHKPPPSQSSNGKFNDLSVLSTHPQTAERIERVRAQPDYAATPALSSEDWNLLRDACGPQIRMPAPAATPAAAGPPSQPAPSTSSPPPKRSASNPPTPSPAPAPAPKQPATNPPSSSSETPAPSTPAPAPPRSASNAPAPAPQPAPKIDPQADREIAETTKTLASSPKDTEALQKRARAHSRKGDHEAALADYASAIGVKPQDADLQYGRGTALQNLRRYEEALTAYDEALRLAPGHSNARNNRGNVNRVLKRYDAALQDFDEIIRAQPDFVHGLYNRGLVYREMNRLEEAVRDFTATIEKDKTYTAAYTSRGIAHERMGARDKAIDDFRAALTVSAKYNNGVWAHNTARERLKTLGVSAP